MRSGESAQARKLNANRTSTYMNTVIKTTGTRERTLRQRQRDKNRAVDQDQSQELAPGTEPYYNTGLPGGVRHRGNKSPQ